MYCIGLWFYSLLQYSLGTRPRLPYRLISLVWDNWSLMCALLHILFTFIQVALWIPKQVLWALVGSTLGERLSFSFHERKVMQIDHVHIHRPR
jgi:hypothetical protein